MRCYSISLLISPDEFVVSVIIDAFDGDKSITVMLEKFVHVFGVGDNAAVDDRDYKAFLHAGLLQQTVTEIRHLHATGNTVIVQLTLAQIAERGTQHSFRRGVALLHNIRISLTVQQTEVRMEVPKKMLLNK